MKVAVLGGAGFVGGELLRILLAHPAVEDVLATSRSRAGQPIGDVHPPLAGRTPALFQVSPPGEAARGRDAVFLALEHGASSRVMAEVLEAGPSLVVDLAADFRIADAGLRERVYGPHPAPGLVPRFVCGLPDVLGPSLRGATALAVPGCFATAAALALWPLAAARLEGPPVLFAVTGSSGGGAEPRPAAHHPFRAHNLFAYGVFGHRHEAEIAERWRAWTGRNGASPRLAVHAGPFVRGIYLTLHARLAGRAAETAAGYREAYAGRRFVRVLSEPPELTHVLGTNDARIHAAPSADGRELQVMVAIDNLIKGAAGQAVQAMNLALGIPEETGLAAVGAFPC
ncbi:MAG: N-acetyl-gamma-glutamyl-phosphate reductase [Gemmatimonadota bacterium]